jgi:hypothetical protein
MPGFPLARGSVWAGGCASGYTPSQVPPRGGATSCRETAPLTYYATGTCTRAGCKRSHTDPLRYVRPRQLRPDGKSHHGHACCGAGCRLRSTAQIEACTARLPSITVQAVTARCMGRNTQNRGQLPVTYVFRRSRLGRPAGASGRGCLTISPQPAHEHPPSHPTVTYRVPPSGHTPHGSGWRDGPILSERSSK